MTDNDLIKSLDICQNGISMCSDCSYSNDYTNCNTRIAKDALELINRQKAEIERLRSLVDDSVWDFCSISGCEGASNDCWKTCPDSRYNKIKTKAIGEFAGKLKQNITKSIDNYWNSNEDGYYLAEDVLDEIDILVKEIIGDAIVKEIPTDSE